MPASVRGRCIGYSKRLIGNKVETEPVLDAERRNLANMIEPPVCGGYTALCQINLITCYGRPM